MPDFPYMKIANNNIFAASPKGFLYPMFYEFVRNRTCLHLHVVRSIFNKHNDRYMLSLGYFGGRVSFYIM